MAEKKVSILSPERNGILIWSDGTVRLCHEGQLRKIVDCQPEKRKYKKDDVVWFYDVRFDDGTEALISGLTIRAVIYRRTVECGIDTPIPVPESHRVSQVATSTEQE